jgi:hypothetical protein
LTCPEVITGTVAFTDGRLWQAGPMPRRYYRVPASWSSFAGFRFPPEVILVAVRSMPLS